MPRIAILGSCITRDLWPVRGELPDLLYISRTSFPSLLAQPLAGFRPAAKPPAGLGRHQHNALVADLQKTALARLVAFRPTHLIFDFIDERFDLLSVGASLVTHSWELEVSGYLKQRAFKGARPIARLGGACERLWMEAAIELAALIQSTPLRNALPILHSARWADHARGAGGRDRPIGEVEALPGRPIPIAGHNDLLARYERRFLELTPNAAVVAAPEHRLADPQHQWGLSPFHYVPDYYAAIWRALEGLGVERALSAPPAAPSVPVA
jgi:hypothetical protein